MQRPNAPCVCRCAGRSVLASRLGYEAVNALMAGKSNVMVGVLNNDLSFTSFDDAITKEKKVNDSLMKMAQILAL